MEGHLERDFFAGAILQRIKNNAGRDIEEEACFTSDRLCTCLHHEPFPLMGFNFGI